MGMMEYLRRACITIVGGFLVISIILHNIHYAKYDEGVKQTL